MVGTEGLEPQPLLVREAVYHDIRAVLSKQLKEARLTSSTLRGILYAFGGQGNVEKHVGVKLPTTDLHAASRECGLPPPSAVRGLT